MQNISGPVCVFDTETLPEIEPLDLIKLCHDSDPVIQVSESSSQTKNTKCLDNDRMTKEFQHGDERNYGMRLMKTHFEGHEKGLFISLLRSKSRHKDYPRDRKTEENASRTCDRDPSGREICHSRPLPQRTLHLPSNAGAGATPQRQVFGAPKLL